jgi:hypothetical protein
MFHPYEHILVVSYDNYLTSGMIICTPLHCVLQDLLRFLFLFSPLSILSYGGSMGLSLWG